MNAIDRNGVGGLMLRGLVIVVCLMAAACTRGDAPANATAAVQTVVAG